MFILPYIGKPYPCKNLLPSFPDDFIFYLIETVAMIPTKPSRA